MWGFIARFILKNRLFLFLTIVAITAFMGYAATKIQLSFEFARVLPVSDSTQIFYENFKKKFGEDGNVMVVGFEDKNLFQLEKFNDWRRVSEQVRNMEGIKHILSISHLHKMDLNDSLKSLDFKPVISGPVESQPSLDSIRQEIFSYPFYRGFIYSSDRTATLLAITFHKKDLDSKNRIAIVRNIKELTDAFGSKHQLNMHYSGMPFIRTEFMNKVGGEMKLFLVLAALIISAILFAIFRSVQTVLYSLGTVIVGVVWALGTIYLFGYKITILSGLIPPLILIIGIPNCVFLINKYHSEILAHGNKSKALYRTVEKVGLSLFLANITTAIGFGVFYFTESPLLVEFGVVSAINVMATYFLTLILIPIILSVLPVPAGRRTNYLRSEILKVLIDKIEFIVQNRRKSVYLIITLFTIVSVFGIFRVKINGYVVDDLPKNHPIYSDLRFFESKFGGILPFEIAIDAKKENGVFEDDAKTLYKIKALQNQLNEFDVFSKPISVVEGIRFTYQQYKGGQPKYYILPGKSELKVLSEFKSGIGKNEQKLLSFVDSTKSVTRLSYQVKDIGSIKMDELVKELRSKTDSIFDPAEYDVTFTGHSLVFLKNNSYLLSNLFESLLIEIILVTIVGMFLFRSIRIILLSKVPCLIPLIITAGIMGFFNIDFKPSTILIFTIAFGISSDSTIYFLTKYRQELKRGYSRAQAVSISIQETGVSMVYSVLILFFGFGVFAFSGFGGTVALGILVATTLFVSLCTNLILLPAILLSLDRYISRKDFTEEQLIEIEDEDETSSENLKAKE